MATPTPTSSPDPPTVMTTMSQVTRSETVEGPQRHQAHRRPPWRLDRQTGSHRQYRHKPGTVTVAGEPGSDLKA
jgi:hypothetical protein